MSSDRETVLKELGVDARTAIHRAKLERLFDGERPIAPKAQKRVLQYLKRFPSDKCWELLSDIAIETEQSLRTVEGTVRAMVAAGLVCESPGEYGRTIRSVVWSEIGRRFPRNETQRPIPITSDVTECPARPDTSVRSRSSLVVPNARPDRTFDGRMSGLTGHDAPNCPVRPDTNVRSIEEKEFSNKESSSSSSSTAPERPPADDDGGGVFDFCRGRDSHTWDDVDRHLQAIGIDGSNVIQADITTAKNRGLRPSDVIDAVFIVANNRRRFRNPPGALRQWIRGTGWPVQNVPTADEVEQKRARKAAQEAEAERRLEHEHTRRTEKAESIRHHVDAEAASLQAAPSPRTVLARKAWELEAAKLDSLLSDDERAALAEWKVFDLERQRVAHENKRHIRYIPFDENLAHVRRPDLADAPGAWSPTADALQATEDVQAESVSASHAADDLIDDCQPLPRRNLVSPQSDAQAAIAKQRAGYAEAASAAKC